MSKKEIVKVPDSLSKFTVVENLGEFKEKLQGQRGIALDIDETLSFTIKHWISELQAKFGNPENLTAEQLIEKYRYTQNVPYWQTPQALAWMEEARNSNDLQKKLPLIENANSIAQKVDNIIPVLAYPTNRPRSVSGGTISWLKMHQFPPAAIIARPDDIPHLEGTKWKAGILEFLYPEIAGIVDDHPGLVESLSKDYKGTIFLYDIKKYSGDRDYVIPCKKWGDVLSQVELRYSNSNF